MIFVLPDEGGLLELPKIKQKFLKKDELNQEIPPIPRIMFKRMRQ